MTDGGFTAPATRFLDLDDLKAVGKAVLDGPFEVRDWGLIESALGRPATTVFGEDAYPTIWGKAAALMHSLIHNHALVDGNKRVGFTAGVLMLHKNGLEVHFAQDDAYDLVVSIAQGSTEVPDIAARLESWVVAEG